MTTRVTRLLERPATYSLGLLVAFLAVLFVEALGLRIPFLREVVGVLFLLFAPGILLLALIGIDPSLTSRWTIYAVAIGLLVGMAVGLVLNIALPPLGYLQPLSVEAVVPAYTALLLGLVTLLRRVRPESRIHTEFVSDFFELLPSLLFVFTLPFLTVIALFFINDQVWNTPLLLVLGIVSLIPFAFTFLKIDGRVYPLTLWAISISVLLHKSLWEMYGFGGHRAVVTFWRVGRGDLATEPLLQNVALFPLMARLLDIPVLSQMEIINPVIISAVVPVMIYVTGRSYVGNRAAFAATFVFIFSHPFFLQYPTAGRAATPVFFLVLLGVLLTDHSNSLVNRRLISYGAAMGIVVTHYGTSYFVLFALLGASIALLSYRGFDKFIAKRKPEQSMADGGESSVRRSLYAVTRLHSYKSDSVIFTPKFVLFYTVFVLGWYLFTFNGNHFGTLLNHTVNTLTALYTGNLFSGTTATKLTSDYRAPSVQIGKYFYIAISAFMAVGLASVYVRRFISKASQPFDDEFIGISTMLLGVFLLTVLVPGAWGGGRPMMVVFSYTSVFTIVGMTAITGSVYSMLKGTLPNIHPPERVDSVSVLSVLLVAFFLLNSGFVAATLVGGYAPSNVPLQEQLHDSEIPHVRMEVYRIRDIQTHGWIVNHRDPEFKIYGDRIVYLQTDAYAPQIESLREPDGLRYQIRPESESLTQLRGGGIEPGYVVLLGHNVEMNVSVNSNTGWRELGELNDESEARNRVYTTGRSTVYFSNTTVGR